MTNIKFANWQCNDVRQPMTHEAGLRKLLAFSGAHDVVARSVIPPLDITGFPSMTTQGTWGTQTISEVSGTGGATAQWYKAVYAEEVNVGFVAEFDKEGDIGGFVFGIDAALCGYLVWWTATRMGLSALSGTNGYTETKMIDIPHEQTGDAHVTVAVKPIASTAIEKTDDLAITLWFDDRVMFSHTFLYVPTMGKRTGMAIYQNNAAAYKNFRIPQFHQFIEVVYCGPTEQVGAALSRILGMDMIRVQARFDGSVLIWRNDLLEENDEFDYSVILSRTDTEDLYAPNHYRLTSGLYEGDVIAGYDGILGAEQWRGHIFTVGDDPNAVIEPEVYLRTVRKAKQMIELAETVELTLPFRPLIEAEDVIGIKHRYDSDVDLYRVTSVNFAAGWAENGVKYESKLTCRRLCSAF